jgi:mono/diheme cytochrome c family protein
MKNWKIIFACAGLGATMAALVWGEPGGGTVASPARGTQAEPGKVAALPPAAAQFVQGHCVECHDADTKKGGLDLTALPFDLGSSQTFDLWVKVHDRVRDGEMPPKKVKTRPDAAAVKSFLELIATPMVQADQARAVSQGRAVWRRLNRYEYENAVRDLLHAPWLQIKDMLPEDEEAHRFNKAGEALSISHVHMASYLGAADYALRQAMASQVQRPATVTKRYYAREQGAFVGKLKFTQFNRSPERATFPMLGTTGQPDVLDGTAPVTVGAADPVKREQEAFGVVASSYEPLELRFDKFVAPVGGRYHLKLSGYTFWAGPSSEKKWWVPDRAKISPGRRGEPVTLYAQAPPRLLRLIGSVDFSVDPSVQELDTWLVGGESIRPDAARLFRSRPPNYHNPLAEPDGMPGVAFRWLEVQGPIYDQWPTAGHQLMFGDLPLRPPAGAGDPVEVISQDPHADAQRLLRTFMERSYRRPVPEAEVQRFLGVIDSALKTGTPFVDAMIAGYSAVLCSPGFVCVEEAPGRLDDYALASRLSFFLWNSAPDDELRDLAAHGQLHSPAVLRAQARRLLADPRSRQFVDAFLDYWLDLRKIVATAPDASLYPDYYLDDLLSESADLETQLFFNELLRGNLPASNIVSSDFAMLNERLANHYGIPGVTGVGIRKVQLPPDSVRGGLMTQASVLKVTANGTTTSPVLRGAWIMERVLGKPPAPPPPSVPAIEPDTRGATTIRAQLEKHRTQQTCAACHAKIDPAGFALENFDVMGGWRDHYRGVSEPDKDSNPVPGFGHNGQKFAFHEGQPVDASGELPDGRHFQDVRDLKKLLLDDQRQIARNLVQQLIVYGTGAAVRFGDRPEVEKILDRAAPGDYGVRSLIEEIVQSSLFQTK